MYVYAKSCIYVAKYHMDKGGKDLALAQDYLERVAASNAEEVAQAAELLRRLKAAMDGAPPSDDKPAENNTAGAAPG